MKILTVNNSCKRKDEHQVNVDDQERNESIPVTAGQRKFVNCTSHYIWYKFRI